MTTIDQVSDVVSSTDRTSAQEQGTTRWGPAWVGAVVALPVYVVLQLVFVAFGWIALGVDGSGAGATASIVSAVLAIVALFVGGLAGGTASRRSGTSANAALQGAMTWALTAVGVLSLAAVGGATIAGNLGGLVGTITATGPQQFGTNPGALVEANQAIQNGAGWAALWLGVAVVAAILGTLSGASATKGTGMAGRRPEHTREDGARAH
jgi:hypothetical protein